MGYYKANLSSRIYFFYHTVNDCANNSKYCGGSWIICWFYMRYYLAFCLKPTLHSYFEKYVLLDGICAWLRLIVSSRLSLLGVPYNILQRDNRDANQKIKSVIYATLRYAHMIICEYVAWKCFFFIISNKHLGTQKIKVRWLLEATRSMSA